MERRRRASAGFVYPVGDKNVFFDGEHMIPAEELNSSPPPPPVARNEPPKHPHPPLLPAHSSANVAMNASRPSKFLKSPEDRLAELEALLVQREKEVEKYQNKYQKMKQRLNETNQKHAKELSALQNELASSKEEVSACRKSFQTKISQMESMHTNKKNEDLESQLDSCLVENAMLKENLDQASITFQNMKREEESRREQLVALRSKAETLEKLVWGYNQPIEEVLVRVWLPNGKRSSFLVDLIASPDPIRYATQIAEEFASFHRLGAEATRVLVAFTLAECNM